MKLRFRCLLASPFLLAVVACGGSSSTTSPSGSPDGGLTDGSSSPDGGSDAAPPFGLPTPPACASSCTGGQQCIGGSCACPVYQTLCGGQCIPTVNDPDNCGGCGTKCATGQVCSAGACASSCLPGLMACGGQCVDTNTDDANCGTCGTTCGTGQGCIWGTCGPATVKTTSATCPGGGPVPSATIGGQTYCLSELGAATFLPWGLCSCKGLETDANDVVVDAYDSTHGPYTGPSAPGGNVGVNAAIDVNNPMSVSGSLWVGGSDQISIDTRGLTVGGDLHVGNGSSRGSITLEEGTTVAGNAYATAGIQASYPFQVTGALHQPAGSTNSSSVMYGSLVPGPVTVNPPCACDAPSVVPIASLVMQHQTDNDDNAIGLNPDLLADDGMVGRLDLPCGSFYLSAISENQPVVVYVHGRAALYVGGDVASQIAFALDPDAELDVFVAGDLSVNQPVVVGSPSYPSLARIFIAGMVDVDATLQVAGYLYAPNATFDLNEATVAYGGIFANDFDARDVTVHYDRALTAPGPSCAGQ